MNLNDSKIAEKLSIAIENHKKNKFKLAEELYKEILNLNKNHLSTIFYLGTLYSQLKKFSLAKSFLLKADKLNPNNLNINLNIGNLYFNTGESESALERFNKVIRIKPNYILAHFNKGIILNSQRKYKESILCFEKVIEIDPNNINSYNLLGIILQETGDFKKSLFYLKKSLMIAPDNLRVVHTMLNLLKSIQLSNISKKNSTDLVELFKSLYKKNFIDHNELFNSAKSLIFFEENQKQAEQLVSSDTSLLSSHEIKLSLKSELFHLILQKSLLRDKFLENFLYKIRKEFLLLLKNKQEKLILEFLSFIISIAEQSFLNEYVVFQSEEEIKIINELKIKIENNKIINELEISILACYVPLNSSEIISKRLIEYSSNNILFNDLIQIQVKDPAIEKKLKKTISSFDSIADLVSQKVREQYEENPYPRWRYANITPKNNFLSILNNNIRPNKVISKSDHFKPNVLIAGCGTGQQLVSKTSYANANILAVDLSLSSLSFAKRKMQEMNHKSIEFLQGDLLKLNSLNKKFNIIECVGVLHHLKNPEEGLKVLLDILEPNGYLKLGLYSESARRHIVEIRDFIKKNNFKSSIRQIRDFREFIKKDKENQSFQKLNYNFDFYSTSNVRDLIFHVQEHRYTLPMISKLLNKYNLEFLGFTNSSKKKEYSKYYPNDLKNTSLENWNNFEKNNPDLFRDMYQFWVKKND